MSVSAKDVFQSLPPEGAGYIFVRYTLSGTDDLSIYFMDLGQFAEAIRAGKLKGEVKYKKKVIGKTGREDDGSDRSEVIDCIRITDSSEKIMGFIKASNPELLFSGPPVNFKKQVAPKGK